MAGIIPIPNSRITGLLTRQRLTQQYQADQLDLFRLQEQISTGQRISLPSEDAPAALRAISLQRLLDRKGQLDTNIQSGLLFLGATDDALNSVAGLLSKIKADTLGVVGTVATQQQRDAAIADINNAIESLVSLGNRQFNGRYIFAGSQTSQPPYSVVDGNVIYDGDDRAVRSHSDIGVLFSSNTTGQTVFGGTSDAVQGTADLNPQLTSDTLLSSLLGGRGINANGALQISDTSGNTSSIVDISNASTIGDVVALIEANPPPGRQIEVTVTSNGLKLQLDGGQLAVSEVGTGTTARELGLIDPPVVANSITGDDLDPVLLKTTQLGDLLGSKARALLKSGGGIDNNDILIEASVNGLALDGVTVTLVDGGDIGATATVNFDSFAKTLTIFVDDNGETTANHVVDAINADGNFTAALDPTDTTSVAEAGTGPVSIGATVDTAGGSGETFDQTSGIHVVNGGQTYDITFGNAETVEDLLNILNSSEAGLLAEINADGSGINVRSRVSGTDFQIGEIGGQTATQLGVRTYTGGTKISELNYGVGLPTRSGDDITITARDGTSFGVDLTSANTVQDVIDLINGAPGNSGLVSAQLATTGNGIELTDLTGATAVDLELAAVEGSQAAEYLGFVPAGQPSVSSATGVLQSSDRHFLETESVFTTLIRLRDALAVNDLPAIERVHAKLGDDIDRATFAQADVGARYQGLQLSQENLQDEDIQLRSALSEQIDVDLIQAISDLTARQISLEASLRATANLLQLSLLNFI